MDHIETVSTADEVLAYIVRAEAQPNETEFITPSDVTQQVGFIVYGAGEGVEPHVHTPLSRQLVGTTEVLMVRRGHMMVDFFDDGRHKVATCELGTGDAVVLVSGGHGIRFVEDTILLEVKQGPYTGLQEKERFSE